MEEARGKASNPNPKKDANFLSLIFFWWVNSFIGKGSKKLLEVSDLYDVLPEDKSKTLGCNLQQEWDKELLRSDFGNKYKPSLTRAIIRTFGFTFFLTGFSALFEECFLRVGQPICLGLLMHYIANEENTAPTEQAYLYASAIILGAALFLLMNHTRFFICQNIGISLRIAACSLLYRKCLYLNQKALGETTIGEIVNLMSNDVNRFDSSVMPLHYIWAGPLQTLISTVVLYYVVGSSCLVVLAVFVVFIPFQSWIGRVFSTLRYQTALQTDNRIRIMNEVISAMKVIKMYTWEKSFAKLVSFCRQNEIKVIRKANYFRALNMTMYLTTSAIIKLMIFLVYILTGNHLTAGKVFITVSLIDNIRYVMTVFFPTATTAVAETLVSIKRIEKFLLADETSCFSLEKLTQQTTEQSRVELNQFTVKWPALGEDDSDTLTDITFKVGPGQVLGIIGPVGSGKTSLLNAILGELPPKSGTSEIVGKIAYAGQESWIYSGTIRQNILCGLEYDPERYRKVIKACALKKDFELLPKGDLTAVGEKGVSLSGGQKARVNLARALYVDADIYLMDDPLSAVDPKVGRHLIDNAINRFLCDKIRILVTHQLHHLKDADEILILKAGRIEARGSFKEISNSGTDIGSMMNSDAQQHRVKTTSISDYDWDPSISRCRSNTNTTRYGSVAFGEANLENEVLQPFEEEHRSSSSVSFRVYRKYFQSGFGCCSFLFFATMCFLTQMFFSGSDYWLSLWTNAEENRSVTDSDLGVTNNTVIFSENWWQTPSTYTGIWIFSLLVIGTFIFSLIQTTHFYVVCTHSSIALHNRMFESIIRSPLLFFDRNPVGRVLNRFTRDIGCMDELLPAVFYYVITIAVKSVGTLFLIGLVNIYLLLPICLLSIVIWKLQQLYLRTSRDLKRLEATTRSPVYTHLSSSLTGLTTLRAHQSQSFFRKVFDDFQDIHSSTSYMIVATVRWFGLWVDLICVAYLSCVTYICIGLGSSLTRSEAGLAITSAMTFTEMFQWGFRQLADVENQMTSVERVIEYSKLPPEASLESTPDVKPPPTWPSKGIILFDRMSLRYSDNELPVLKNISCLVQANEKIGIVGRTGAGKSSLITALFRLAEPEGRIVIDGVDTMTIGLHDLRSKISIIPQDPVLFSGSLRKNLDPFDEYSDEAVWSALEGAKLKDTVKELSAGLESVITEGGSNFSVGQRQLICLARALLRQNRILVLDEATANVDLKTDELIQMTIREKFRDCTVLTIAHRLNTIMDSDKVMVLDSGYLKEFGEPSVLLQDPDGMFYGLVAQTGPVEASELYDMARQAAEFRREKSIVQILWPGSC